MSTTSKSSEDGNCILNFKEGNTFIRICNDYCAFENQKELNLKYKENIAKLYLSV